MDRSSARDLDSVFLKVSRAHFEDRGFCRRLLTMHRTHLRSLLSEPRGLRLILLKRAGRNFFKSISDSYVKSLDDLPIAALRSGIGIVDIVRESLNRMVVRIYECVSCFASPPIGTTMCDFEAGFLEAAMEKLFGRNRVVETRCWGLGYSFCEFEIEFLW